MATNLPNRGNIAKVADHSKHFLPESVRSVFRNSQQPYDGCELLSQWQIGEIWIMEWNGHASVRCAAQNAPRHPKNT